MKNYFVFLKNCLPKTKLSALNMQFPKLEYIHTQTVDCDSRRNFKRFLQNLNNKIFISLTKMPAATTLQLQKNLHEKTCDLVKHFLNKKINFLCCVQFFWKLFHISQGIKATNIVFMAHSTKEFSFHFLMKIWHERLFA